MHAPEHQPYALVLDRVEDVDSVVQICTETLMLRLGSADALARRLLIRGQPGHESSPRLPQAFVTGISDAAALDRHLSETPRTARPAPCLLGEDCWSPGTKRSRSCPLREGRTRCRRTSRLDACISVRTRGVLGF